MLEARDCRAMRSEVADVRDSSTSMRWGEFSDDLSALTQPVVSGWLISELGEINDRYGKGNGAGQEYHHTPFGDVPGNDEPVLHEAGRSALHSSCPLIESLVVYASLPFYLQKSAQCPLCGPWALSLSTPQRDRDVVDCQSSIKFKKCGCSL